MISYQSLRSVIESQMELFVIKDTGIIRDIPFEKHLKTKQITVITGVRRSGKSTLLVQFSKHIQKYYYINFDDERLVSFTVADFEKMMEIFRGLYNSKILFIDEIQNVYHWERFVRRVYDEGYKIYLTGSNSKLLDSNLSVHLTGRYFPLRLYPFSFKEYLKFRKISPVAKNKLNIIEGQSIYIQKGGFPEYIKYQDEDYLHRIYEDILYRDILTKKNIRETKAFRQLATFLFSNISKEASYNSLSKTLGFKSVMSVKNYISFIEESYLIFEHYKYDHSLKKQYISNKKIYGVDTGLRNAVSFSTSEDMGRLIENVVFIELQRRERMSYYFKNKHECDFVIMEKGKITEAIQVTSRIDEQNQHREIEGLMEANHALAPVKLLIITSEQEELLKYKGKKISIIPLWKWLTR